MAIKSSDQISIIDVTDAYSVTLTSDSHTFPGSTSAALAGSITTQVVVLCGAQQVAGTVTVSEITKPTGVTVSSDGDAVSPTLTITLSTSVTTSGVVKIPVHIGDITIIKDFSFAIAFKGSTGSTGASVTVTKTEVTYSSSTSTTQPTTWDATIPTVAEGSYLWTKTVVTYSDGKSATTYMYAKQGAKGSTGSTGPTGTSVTVSSTAVTYGTSTVDTTQPTSWAATLPTVAEGSFLWTKTVVTYSDGKSTTSYMYAKQGAKGSTGSTGPTGNPGADAITLTITSSNGQIFKNTSIVTVLTAHVYKAGVELTAAQITALGTVKWYKDGGTTAAATGLTLTIDAGQVTNKATYVAQLEG